MEPSAILPRIGLGSWPTPVRRLDRVSRALGVEVWLKSEEACGAWGGNKIRKLEYILASLEGRAVRTLVAYGAGTSSWAAAVALHGSARGYEVRLGLGGAIPDEYAALYRRLGTRVHQLASYSLLPVAAATARVAAGARGVARLPAGGSGTRGDVGSMNAGVEIAQQVRDGLLPAPRAIFVPAGTSGTACGVAVGTHVSKLATEVVAVRVTPRPFGTPAFVHHRIRRLTRRLRRSGVDVPSGAGPRVTGDGRFFPPAYGIGNEASAEAIALARTEGVELDPTYAAKGFAALIARARAGSEGPYLFLHTSPGALPGVAGTTRSGALR